MPIAALAVNKDRAAEIEALMALSDKELDNLQNTLARRSAAFAQYSDAPEQTQRSLSEKLGEPAVRSLVSLRRFADRRNADMKEVVDALEEGLRRFGWTDAKLAQFTARKSRLTSLLQAEALHSTYKILDLYHDVHLHLHDAKIITEIKPVFDEKRSTIDGFILFNVLKIVYSDGHENEQEINIALELEEIKNLQLECERALIKTATTKSELREKMNVPIIIYSDKPASAQ